jgi:hypothetical protein
MYHHMSNIERTLARETFDVLIKNPQFLRELEESVKAIAEDGKVDMGDAAEIVHIIVSVIEHQPRVRLEPNDLGTLIRLLYDFVVAKYEIFDDMETADKFGKIVDSSIRLVLMRPKVNEAVGGCLDRLGC